MHSKTSVIVITIRERAGSPGFFSLTIIFISSKALPLVMISAVPLIWKQPLISGP